MSNKSIYKEIKDKILDKFGKSKNNYPTFTWVMGTFKKLQDYERLRRMVTHSSDVPHETMEKFEKQKILVDTALEHGLITDIEKPNGKHVLRVTGKGSKFLQELNQNIHSWNSLNSMNHKELKKTFLKGVEEADREWFDSLSREDQKMVEIYSQLSLKEYSLIKGLWNSKTNKENYQERLSNLQYSSPENFEYLKGLGFINDKSRLNSDFTEKFISTISSLDYSHLKHFNRSISSKTDRISADKALAQNALQRSIDKNSPRSSDTGLRAQKFIEDSPTDLISDIVKLKNKEKYPNLVKDISLSNREDLKLNGIIDSNNNLTTFGQIVANLINRDSDTNDENDVLRSRLSGKPGGRLDRRGEIAQGRKRSFKNYVAK